MALWNRPRKGPDRAHEACSTEPYLAVVRKSLLESRIRSAEVADLLAGLQLPVFHGSIGLRSTALSTSDSSTGTRARARSER